MKLGERFDLHAFKSKTESLRQRFIPQRLRPTRQPEIVGRSEEDEMIDDGRRLLEDGELGFQIARLADAASEPESDAEIANVAGFIPPFEHRQRSIDRMIADLHVIADGDEFPVVLFDAEHPADLQPAAKTAVDFRRRRRQRPDRLQFSFRGPHVLRPAIAKLIPKPFLFVRGGDLHRWVAAPCPSARWRPW